MPDDETARIVNVKNCARCEQNHRALAFFRFKMHPVEDSDGTFWRYWSICPVTEDPILLKVTSKPEIATKSG